MTSAITSTARLGRMTCNTAVPPINTHFHQVCPRIRDPRPSLAAVHHGAPPNAGAQPFGHRLGGLTSAFDDTRLPAFTERHPEQVGQRRPGAFVAEVLLMLHMRDGGFQPRPEMPPGFQANRQGAPLGTAAGRAGHFVLAGLNHDRLDFGQFGDLSAHRPRGHQRFQVLPAPLAGARAYLDDLIPLVAQRPLSLRMSGFGSPVAAPLRLGCVRLLIARRRLRRVARGGRSLPIAAASPLVRRATTRAGCPRLAAS